jgi:hypothetical protein
MQGSKAMPLCAAAGCHCHCIFLLLVDMLLLVVHTLLLVSDVYNRMHAPGQQTGRSSGVPKQRAYKENRVCQRFGRCLAESAYGRARGLEHLRTKVSDAGHVVHTSASAIGLLQLQATCIAPESAPQRR